MKKLPPLLRLRWTGLILSLRGEEGKGLNAKASRGITDEK